MTGTALRDHYTADELVALFQQGDRNAFGKLYDNYAPALFGMLREMTGKNKKAEEVLQKAFREVWDKRILFDSRKERIFTWIFKIARTLAIRSLRQQEKNSDPDNPSAGNPVCSMNGPGVAEIHKTAFGLIYFKGFTFDEVAATLNVPAAVLKDKFVNAIKQLREITVT
jgi:DNA-directed RNA polymerase specialized sigma24 family protein